ncbi:lipase maturation factor-domain-containing protein [Baffinella frigidus]|nr:lipase maturation factor-domain-containing protein [Cryptophyta sp. CCMP2293]
MTGVGQEKKVFPNSGGVPLRVVARPELELQASDDMQSWTPLEFQFKPGNVTRAPRLTGLPGFPDSFPGMHQPRLDWQMWFAALGSYQNNPWLVMLVFRLLQGTAPVRALMAPELWPEQFREHAPKAIRIVKFEYDMTRLPKGGKGKGKGKGGKGGAAWWKRKEVGEYLPALTLDNPSLRDFVGQFNAPPFKASADGGRWQALAGLLRAHDVAIVRAFQGAALLAK